MLNHVVVIGKVYSMPIEKKDKKGSREISFILQVERPFTESDGSYVFDTDMLSYDYGTIVEENTKGEEIEHLCKGFTVNLLKYYLTELGSLCIIVC